MPYKTFALGETCCRFRNAANSKTRTKIQNKYNNGNTLQMKKRAAESQNKYINSKHAANIETKQNQKRKQMQQENATYPVNTNGSSQGLGGGGC